jgi:hypothetical protein
MPMHLIFSIPVSLFESLSFSEGSLHNIKKVHMIYENLPGHVRKFVVLLCPSSVYCTGISWASWSHKIARIFFPLRVYTCQISVRLKGTVP